MNAVKSFFKRHKVTLMIIPTTDKSIRQIKFNLGIAFVGLCILTVFNIGLFSATILKTTEAQRLSYENFNLSDDLLVTKDKINVLSSINDSRKSEVDQLKKTLMDSSEHMKLRLEEMETTNSYVKQLVTLFNSETNSTLKAPVSRSFSRTSAQTVDKNLPSTVPAIDVDASIIDEIQSLTQNDEIEKALADQNDSYQSLIQSIEERLTYLDRRPDFYPTSGKLSSGFGYRTDPITGRTSMHNGIDISNKVGTPIYAAGAGIVTFSKYNGQFGNVLIVDHGQGYETVYAHCNKFIVSSGDTVEKGQQIATIGRSGRTTGSHLHFELRYHGTAINPFKTLNQK